MRMQHDKSMAGISLVEISFSITILTVGMAVMTASLGRGSSYSRAAEARVSVEETGRLPMPYLTDLLIETSPRFLDTTARYHFGSEGFDFSSDHFIVQGMSQCPSATCGFHTRNDLTVDRANYQCGFAYRGEEAASEIWGKNWPEDVERCAFDDSALVQYGRMDVLKTFVARGLDGEFTMDGGRPTWDTMVVLCPVVDEEGACNLVRYDLSLADVIAMDPEFSENWDRWDPLEPSLPELFDFGSDGTLDGVPDGSVPVTAETSDANIEIFLPATSNKGPALLFEKTLGEPTDVTYRRLYFVIFLDTNEISLQIHHQEEGERFWSVNGMLEVSPQVVVSDLSEFSVSTRVSNPWDRVTNPTGIKTNETVRVTLGTTKKITDRGEVSWVHHVDTFTVHPAQLNPMDRHQQDGRILRRSRLLLIGMVLALSTATVVAVRVNGDSDHQSAQYHPKPEEIEKWSQVVASLGDSIPARLLLGADGESSELDNVLSSSGWNRDSFAKTARSMLENRRVPRAKYRYTRGEVETALSRVTLAEDLASPGFGGGAAVESVAESSPYDLVDRLLRRLPSESEVQD